MCIINETEVWSTHSAEALALDSESSKGHCVGRNLSGSTRAVRILDREGLRRRPRNDHRYQTEFHSIVKDNVLVGARGGGLEDRRNTGAGRAARDWDPEVRAASVEVDSGALGWGADGDRAVVDYMQVDMINEGVILSAQSH